MPTAPPTTARIPTQRTHRRQPGPDEPLFTALAAEWRQIGRIVPGDRDREWVDNVVRNVWR